MESNITSLAGVCKMMAFLVVLSVTINFVANKLFSSCKECKDTEVESAFEEALL